MYIWGAYDTRLKVTLLPSKVYKNTRLFTISEVKIKSCLNVGLCFYKTTKIRCRDLKIVILIQ